MPPWGTPHTDTQAYGPGARMTGRTRYGPVFPLFQVQVKGLGD